MLALFKDKNGDVKKKKHSHVLVRVLQVAEAVEETR
jgi:hypothetical protein